MKYEEKILTYLVDNYRKSKKDSGNNKTNRRTQVKPEKIYKKYNANDGDFEEISRLNQLVNKLTEKGFIYTKTEAFGTQIQSIYLVDESILDIEKYLSDKYGYVSKDLQIEQLQLLVDYYKNASPICEKECALLSESVDNRKVPKNYKELDAVFKAISFIENNQTDLYIREVSMKVYGDSKFFEKVTLQPVCTLLRKYSDRTIEENELIDEILVDYHIYKEPQKLCIKGNVVITISGNDVDLSGFSEGIEIMASDLTNIQSIKICASKFMTIENKTSFLRYKDDDTVTFYLGGYANRYQREFIKMVHDTNPDIKCMHFGDIDAGGFWIHHNLCEITGINFALFYMSSDELKNERYESCLQGLTENDIARLKELKEMDLYAYTVNYMLENNVKMEQEIISLNLMNRKFTV
ncbi:Wadjet anti-phage system protein JetD domain-containing protein [Gottfriedia solisilvae]|uniref:Wadjet anti-phage system protein JetD domain-containing protein n=1 Tax=Gottfriedia solisilvae TaxID=1516104 RepID=UPI003D2EC15D